MCERACWLDAQRRDWVHLAYPMRVNLPVYNPSTVKLPHLLSIGFYVACRRP